MLSESTLKIVSVATVIMAACFTFQDVDVIAHCYAPR